MARRRPPERFVGRIKLRDRDSLQVDDLIGCRRKQQRGRRRIVAAHSKITELQERSKIANDRGTVEGTSRNVGQERRQRSHPPRIRRRKVPAQIKTPVRAFAQKRTEEWKLRRARAELATLGHQQPPKVPPKRCRETEKFVSPIRTSH